MAYVGNWIEVLNESITALSLAAIGDRETVPLRSRPFYAVSLCAMNATISSEKFTNFVDL
jgi:hypothetical protein